MTPLNPNEELRRVQRKRPSEDGLRLCSSCAERKSPSEFHRRRLAADGYNSQCIACRRKREQPYNHEYQREYRARPHVKRATRNRDLRRRYGITIEEYEALFVRQSGLCVYCECRSDRELHVDHDHLCCPGKAASCGRCIRGLACSRCNLAIGQFLDSPALLRQVAGVLEGLAA